MALDHRIAEAQAPRPASTRRGALRISGEATHAEIHQHWSGELPARTDDVITVFVSDGPFTGDVQASAADAICYAVPNGGMLLLRDEARIDPYGVQLIRKRTVSALLAADARAELERIAGITPTVLPEATPAECATALQALFPQIRDSLFYCTGLAAEAAVFTAVGDVLGPVTMFYAQNGYGGTGQLIADLLARGGKIQPRPLEVIGHDSAGQPVTLVDRVLASLATLDGAACVFLETPTNPELQVHDFPALMAGVRAHQQRTGKQVPIIIDTTFAPLYPIFGKDFTQDWPFVLVKSGSKYFTKGKTTLGVVACAADSLARTIVARAHELGDDADSFARPAQLAELRAGLSDLVPRMATISANTIRLATGLRAALRARGHEITPLRDLRSPGRRRTRLRHHLVLPSSRADDARGSRRRVCRVPARARTDVGQEPRQLRPVDGQRQAGLLLRDQPRGVDARRALRRSEERAEARQRFRSAGSPCPSTPTSTGSSPR